MSIPTPNPSQDKMQERRATTIAIVFMIAIVVNLILSISQGVQTGAWQHFARGGLVIAFGVVTISATQKIRSGETEKGIWFILGGFLGTLTSTSFLFSGFSLILILIELVVGGTLTFLTLPYAKRGRAFSLIGLAAALTYAIDLLPLNYRIPAPPELTRALPAIATVVVILILIIIWQNLRRGSVRAKLLAPTLAVVTIAILAIIAFNASSSVQAIDESADARQKTLHQVFLGRLTDIEDLAVALSLEVANNPEVQEAFANRDRERLTELTLASYLLIDEEFGVPQHQFHLAPATSFLRLHNLEKFDDDLSSFRNTVLAANAEKHPISGLEIGRGGLGVRGVVPVNYEGKHLGTVEFGVNVDQNLINAMKTQYGSDWQILLSAEPAEVAIFEGATGETAGPIPELLFQASTLETPFYADKELYQKALQGETNISHFIYENREVALLSAPLHDFSGNVIGVINIVDDHTPVIEQQNSQITISIFLLLGALILVGASIFFITSRTLQPVTALTNVANAIAGGDFGKTVEIDSEDELGVLAQAFNTMTNQLQSFIETLEQRVADRTKDQETVANIATQIATIPDLHEMLATTVHLTQRGFGLYHAHVFTFDKDNEELEIVACGYQEGDEHEGTHGTTVIPLAQQQSLVSRCARSRAPVIVNDVRSDPDWLPNPLLPKTRAELAVPLIVGDELLGVLDVQAVHEDAFTDADANIQMTLGAQVAVAMQNILEHEIAQKVASDLNVVAEVGIATSTITETDRLLQEVVDLTKESFSLYHAHVYLLNEDEDNLLLTAGAGDIGMQMVSQRHSIPLAAERSLVARAARTREGVVVNDVTERPDHLPNPLLPKTRAEMAVPMVAAGKLIGVLDVQSEQKGRFTDIDVNIKTTLASQIAISLENARSLERTRKQAEYEAKLNLITQRIQHASTIEDAMQIAARELGQALGRRRTIVALDPTALGVEEKGETNE